MSKRGRSEDSGGTLVSFLGERLLQYLIFPHLSGRALGQLGKTCKAFYELTKDIRRVKLHRLQFRHPRDWFGERDLVLAFGNQWAYEGMEQLKEYGYLGENKTLCYDRASDRFVLFNDFYAQGFYSDHWDSFVENLRADTEFDFQWRFIEFTPLSGRRRFKVVKPFCTVHRGSCVWVSFKARF